MDCTVRSRWEAEASRLRELLQRGPPPAEQLDCPYPGLVAFGHEDAGQFFGRDQESDDISRRVRLHNFLLVIGPSGSGKSQTLRALAGAMRPDHGRIALEGDVLFDDQSGIDLPPQARHVLDAPTPLTSSNRAPRLDSEGYSTQPARPSQPAGSAFLR